MSKTFEDGSSLFVNDVSVVGSWREGDRTVYMRWNSSPGEGGVLQRARDERFVLSGVGACDDRVGIRELMKLTRMALAHDEHPCILQMLRDVDLELLRISNDARASLVSAEVARMTFDDELRRAGLDLRPSVR